MIHVPDCNTWICPDDGDQACQVSRILRDSHAFILKHAFRHA